MERVNDLTFKSVFEYLGMIWSTGNKLSATRFLLFYKANQKNTRLVESCAQMLMFASSKQSLDVLSKLSSSDVVVAFPL